MEISGFSYNFTFDTAGEPDSPTPIASCRFCGCQDITTLGYARGLSGGLRFAVSCPACKARGPEAASKVEAIAKWNGAN